MTGKEFFGKLLNNHQEEESPWEGEKVHDDAPESAPVADDHVGGQSHGDASPRSSFDQSTHEEPSSYVDAPVTELHAHASSQADADVDFYDSDSFDAPSRRDDEENLNQDSAEGRDDARESDEPSQIELPGGDGLSTDLPDVRPSRHDEEHPSLHERNGQNEFEPESDLHDTDVTERKATDYLSDSYLPQEQRPQEPQHAAGYEVSDDFEAEAFAETEQKETREHQAPASSYDDQQYGSDPGAHTNGHADHLDSSGNNDYEASGLTAPERSPAPTNSSPPFRDEGARVETSPNQASAQIQQDLEQRQAPSPQPHHPEAPIPSNNGTLVTHPTQQDPAPAEAPANPTEDLAQRSQKSAPPKAPETKKTSAEKDGGKDSGSSAKASKVSDADVQNVKDRVVHRLLEKNVVTVDQVKNAIADRNKQGLKATLWRILAQQGTVDRERVYREAALTYAFEERKIDEGTIDVDFIRQVADVFPEKKRNRLIELHIVPIGYEFEQQTQLLRVVFITHDPSLPVVRELMQDLNLERYELQYASETTVKDLLARAFPKKNEYLERMTDDPLAYDLGTSFEDEKSELIDEDALEAEINRSSLINLFEGALVEAVHRGASDIHIYPNPRRQIEIHFRVDGRLLHWHTEDKIHPESLLAVIKDNTMNVDRFERDMAQDGFIQRKVDDTLIRYRVSILPIATASNNIHAESIVIRVLDDRKVITDLSKLGLLKGALERFDMAIRQPHGMVILTGPTGSGKSTTLVAALHQVVTPEVNVLTVEDPVEYIIPGVRQIKLNHKLGLEGALRAILRHDPDVVMVGEMRDRATAELAVKLANTGHLTFSTLHTNDAPSAVSRLYKMGLEPFLIAYAINLVVAQRLLRTLCPKCKTVDNDPDHVLLERLGFTGEDLREYTIFKASGDPTCKSCKGMGYKGRRAISEAMYFSREIRHMIVEADTKIDEDGLRDMARQEGMLTLQDSAREVVKMGETSVDEMMRVTMTEE